jgi:hypothetical protein
MLKHYLLKREFFLSSNELDINQHYDFQRVASLPLSSWAAEPLELPIRQGSGSSLTKGEPSSESLSVRCVTPPVCSTRSTSWAGWTTRTLSNSMIPTRTQTVSAWSWSTSFHQLATARGGELYQRLSTVSTFDEEHARYVFRQMVEAVSYLHSQKVVHRDLKLENFLLRNKEGWEVALIDFGLSFLWNNNARQEMTAQGQQRVVGTAYYLAPEVIARNYD